MTATSRPGRRRALAWGAALLVAAGVALSLGGSTPAGAAPAGPEHPAAPADPSGSQCSWQNPEGDGNSIVFQLKCPEGIPDPTTENALPDRPAPACTPFRERRWGEWLQEKWYMRCPSEGWKLVHCRDEQSFWFDDEKDVPVRVDSPQWWLDEIAAESSIDEGKGCELAANPPIADCAHTDLDTYKSPGLLPDQCWGTYPTANYELSWEDGAWYDVGGYQDRLMGWFTSLAFLVGRSAMQLALWLVDWAYTFDIKQYTDMTARIAGRYDVRIIDRWQLSDICWLALAAYCGFTALRNRMSKAGGEFLVSFVVAGLAFVLFANRAFYMDYTADAIRLASDDLLLAATGAGGEAPGSDQAPGSPNPESPQLQQARRTRVIRPVQKVLHEEFVERPYVQLNWGSDLDDPKCIAVLNNITSTGWDEHGWPARYMERSDCPLKAEIARFNRDVGGTRLFSSVLIMIMALIVAAMLALSAGTVVLAKFLLAVLFALVPFVTVAGVLPGYGRRVVWTWLGALVQVFLVAAGMAFLLSLMLIGTSEVLVATADAEPLERWGVMLVVVAVVFLTRKRLLTGSQAFSTSLSNAMTRLSPATAHWQGGSSVGFDFDRTDRLIGRNASLAGYTAAYGTAAAALGTVALTAGGYHRRAVERRVGRRALRNLEIMERRREMPIIEGRFDAYNYSDLPPGSGGGGGGGGGGGNPFGGPDPRNGHWRSRGELKAMTRAPVRGSLLHPWRGVSHRRHNKRVHRAYEWNRRRAMRATSKTDYFRANLRHRRRAPRT
jgi:hypothetical protein